MSWFQSRRQTDERTAQLTEELTALRAEAERLSAQLTDALKQNDVLMANQRAERQNLDAARATINRLTLHNTNLQSQLEAALRQIADLRSALRTLSGPQIDSELSEVKDLKDLKDPKDLKDIKDLKDPNTADTTDWLLPLP